MKIEAGQREHRPRTFLGRPGTRRRTWLYGRREFVKWIAFLDVDEMLLPNATAWETL